MRLKDDEIRALRSLAAGDEVASAAILNKFRYLGYIDVDGQLTTRGRYVAAKLPKEEKPDGIVHGQAGAGLGGQSRPGNRQTA